jgi:hypothetical protein
MTFVGGIMGDLIYLKIVSEKQKQSIRTGLIYGFFKRNGGVSPEFTSLSFGFFYSDSRGFLKN